MNDKQKSFEFHMLIRDESLSNFSFIDGDFFNEFLLDIRNIKVKTLLPLIEHPPEERN
jgi:hypothetical protein